MKMSIFKILHSYTFYMHTYYMYYKTYYNCSTWLGIGFYEKAIQANC